MCDKHQHAKLETWVTPINSTCLSSKTVHLFPGDMIHEHTTGPGREEVLVIQFGSVTVKTNGKTERTLYAGECFFIGENTPHEVRNDSDAPAQYTYVVTKKQPDCMYAKEPGACCNEVAFCAEHKPLFHHHPHWRN